MMLECRAAGDALQGSSQSSARRNVSLAQIGSLIFQG